MLEAGVPGSDFINASYVSVSTILLVLLQSVQPRHILLGIDVHRKTCSKHTTYFVGFLFFPMQGLDALGNKGLPCDPISKHVQGSAL